MTNSAGWSSKGWSSKSNWQRSAMEDARQSSKDQWKNSKSRGKWKDMSHNVKELGTLVEKKKNTGPKVARKVRKRETEIHCVGKYGG